MAKTDQRLASLAVPIPAALTPIAALAARDPGTDLTATNNGLVALLQRTAARLARESNEAAGELYR